MRHRVPVNPFYNLDGRRALTAPGRDYAGGNFAVHRGAFDAAGGFNGVRYGRGREDTDLGLRLRRFGNVVYNPAMRVTHKEEYWALSDLMRNALE